MRKITVNVLILISLFILVGCTHEHEYTEEVVAPTCTESGYTIFTCECGQTHNGLEVDALGHSFSEWIITKEATFDEKGSKERDCSACKEKEVEDVPEKKIEIYDYIKQAVIDDIYEHTGYSHWTKDDVVILNYLGEYSGAYVAIIDGDESPIPELKGQTVGGYRFYYNDIRRSEYVSVYYNNKYSTLKSAYEEGIISDDDLKEIYDEFQKQVNN